MKRKQRQKLYKLLIYTMTIIAVFLFLLLSKKARAALFVSIFIFANMVVTGYKKFIHIPIEIEVLTLGIVLSTVAFGINAGLVVAILGGILSFFVGLEISPFAFPMFIGYIFMVFVSFTLRNLDITIVGILTTLANNLAIFAIYHFIFRYDLIKNLRFGISNIIINFILFYNIAPLIFEIMI